MKRIQPHIMCGVGDFALDLHEGELAFMACYIHARGTDETDRKVGDRNRRLCRAGSPRPRRRQDTQPYDR